jgi:signal transduction histidine kinase
LRALRYSLLSLLVAAALGALAAVAAGQLRALARSNAAALASALATDLRSFREHAAYLARRTEPEILAHLGSFHGLARVRLFGPSGSLRFHAERLGDLVATLPPGRGNAADPPPPPAEGTIAISGFRVDESRRDVHPELRTTIAYVARTPEGGALELTVYAEPLLEPLREAGAFLVGSDGATPVGRRADGGFVRVPGEGWTLHHPIDVGFSPIAIPLGLALGLLLLAAAVVALSERQLRAQERAAVERRLAQADRLSSLGLLAAGVAHEVNNPLEGIGNWLKLGNVEKAREGLDRIRRIARELLQFARPKGEEGTADVARCVERALELARFSKELKGVEASVSVAEGLQAALPPHSLEQVLLNLLLNAGAAMRGTGRVEIRGEREGGVVRLLLRDTGPGFAAEDLPHVFDPFFTRSGGSGLGLSVSYGILRTAGGDLRAGNDPRGGAALTVEVPAP